jgi:hypothetical protein
MNLAKYRGSWAEVFSPKALRYNDLRHTEDNESKPHPIENGAPRLRHANHRH